MPTARKLPAATLATLALLGALAGCLSGADVEPAAQPAAPPLDALTEPVFDFGAFLSVKVPAEDGVRLHVDVQLPEGEGPFPLILEYTPYSLLGDEQWAAATERGLRGTPAWDRVSYPLAEYYVPRGYAVGVAHVRGTGESEGCLTVGGPEEGKDGYAIVEHLAQQPWSSGKVALVGTSYVGTTPIETAVLNPPHLTTIIPVSAVTEWYRYYFENGEQRMNGAPPPGASYPDPLLWIAMGVAPGPRTGAADPRDPECPVEYTRQFWLQDDYNAFWEARNISANARNITIPVLYVQGWKDENVATNMMPRFWSQLSGVKKAWLMQVGHGVPHTPERAAYYEYEHRWLDHWLMGRNTDIHHVGNVVVEDNRGKWRMESDWPPRDVRMQRFWPTPDGALAPEPDAEGSLTYLDDGASLSSRPQARDALAGRTLLRFESEPLAEPMHVAGEPVVHLQAASSATDTQFSVLLYERDAEGALRFITRGYLDARHRESLHEGKDLVPGERYAFQWEMHPRDHVVEEGHTLVLIVKSSDPYVIPDETRAANTLHLGAEGSWIDIPTLRHELRQFTDEAPRRGEP